MKRMMFLLFLVLLFLLASSALAMSSGNYHLDWFTPLTGGGGGPTSSSNYAANITVGQTVISASSSEDYQASLGYWYGVLFQRFLFLPLVMRY